jgi:hypothetical protein
VKRSYEEWTKGQYTITTERSGLVVLESPKLVTPRKVLVTPPKRLLIPIERFIKPSSDLLFRPTDSRTPAASAWARRTPLRAVTPMNALLSGGLAQPGLGPMKSRYLAGLNKVDPSFGQLTDIVYPSWVFGQPPSRLAGQVRPRLTPTSARGTPSLLRPTPGRELEFWKWYLNDTQRARRFKEATQSIASSRAVVDDRSWWERLFDTLEDWLDNL